MEELNFLNNIKNLLETPASASPTAPPKDELKSLYSITAKYRTLHEIGKLIASEMDLDALLCLAMDKVIEVTGAQRGFIALVDDKKRIDFKVARNLEKSDIEKPQFQVSRSIIQKVISDGETLCLPDAMADATFGGAESVTRLQLLSVLCTPIKFENRVVGLIYVDNSNVKNLFDEAMADLLTAFSEQVAIALKNAYRFSDLKQSHRQLANELRAKYQFDAIVGSGPRMTQILQLVADITDTDATVLIQGENGTGKELIARALHYNSRRREQPFVTVNCGAIPETLIESELFGYEKGAFTGAVNRKLGKFELADGGTIFLDEIGEMSPQMQVKLLRVLEDGTFTPVGSESEKQCDVRVVAATNRDLKTMLEEKTFREDLYYRLNVITLTMPSLRERREDILLLIEHFITKYHKGGNPPRVSKTAEQILLDYDYPGNVRQLENAIQRAVILCKGDVIELAHLPEEIQAAYAYGSRDADQTVTFQERKQRAIEKFEQAELTRILTLTGGRVRESARVAGMDVKNFSEKLQKYGIKAEDYKK